MLRPYLLVLLWLPLSTLATSFDCTKAKTKTEILICNSSELSQLDDDLGVLYKQAKQVAADQAAFKAENNKQWSLREKNCTDEECLTTWYQQRKQQLLAFNNVDHSNDSANNHSQLSSATTVSSTDVKQPPSIGVDCATWSRGQDKAAFLFPNTMYFDSKDGQVCYAGKDISQWAAGAADMKITTVIPGIGNKFEAIVTTHERLREGDDPQNYAEDSYKNEIVRLSIPAPGGKPQRHVLVKLTDSDKIEDILSGMRLAGYDAHRGTIYFETPTFAVSSGIHVLDIPQDKLPGEIKTRYLTDGSLTAIKLQNTPDDDEQYRDTHLGDLIVCKSRIEEENGRVWHNYLVSRQGKEICQLRPSRPMIDTIQCVGSSSKDEYSGNDDCESLNH